MIIKVIHPLGIAASTQSHSTVFFPFKNKRIIQEQFNHKTHRIINIFWEISTKIPHPLNLKKLPMRNNLEPRVADDHIWHRTDHMTATWTSLDPVGPNLQCI